MKTILLLSIFLFFHKLILSQDLEGEWKGYFTNGSAAGETAISLIFVKKNDAVFTATSKTFLKNFTTSDTSVCVLGGVFGEKKILYLSGRKSRRRRNITCIFRTTTRF